MSRPSNAPPSQTDRATIRWQSKAPPVVAARTARGPFSPGTRSRCTPNRAASSPLGNPSKQLPFPLERSARAIEPLAPTSADETGGQRIGRRKVIAARMSALARRLECARRQSYDRRASHFLRNEHVPLGFQSWSSPFGHQLPFPASEHRPKASVRTHNFTRRVSWAGRSTSSARLHRSPE